MTDYDLLLSNIRDCFALAQLLYTYHFAEIDEWDGGAVEQVGRHPSDFLVARFVRLSQRSDWAIPRSGQSVEGAVEPDARVETPWASVVDHYVVKKKTENNKMAVS